MANNLVLTPNDVRAVERTLTPLLKLDPAVPRDRWRLSIVASVLQLLGGERADLWHPNDAANTTFTEINHDRGLVPRFSSRSDH